MLIRLIGQTKPLFYSAIALSLLAGVMSIALVSIINEIVNSAGDTRTQWLLGFALVAVLSLVTQVVSSILFERLTARAHAGVREHVASRVLAADYHHLERVGDARIKSALTEHSLKVAEFFVGLPRVLTSAVMVVGGLLYIAILSLPFFFMACFALLLGSLGFHFIHLRAISYLKDAAIEQDKLFGHFESLIGGAKEMRLNTQKRLAFFDQVLGKSISGVQNSRIKGMSIFVMATSWGRFLIFAFIGVAMAIMAADGAPLRIMTGFALLFIFMMPPLEVLLFNIPALNFAKIAADHIDNVCQQLVDDEILAKEQIRSFELLELTSVQHRYYHEKSDDFFTLGPVDLSFTPGELVFLVGGNGSGKTTLAKLLVGLYVPEEGGIKLDGKLINNESRDQYRQLFSAVFSDFHLFEQLLEDQHVDLDSVGNALISKLNLQHKVQIKDGAFTSRNLSQGQRKRLALIVACLEDRPFLLFDEWAADQDPAFKDVFYHHLLPELKEQGKTIFVISHDDRYFHLSDRLLKMENGQLVNFDNEGSVKNTALVCKSGIDVFDADKDLAL